jgi:hypothetical protein
MFSFLKDDKNNIDCLPPSKLGYNTNNRHKSFPPIMSDGRSLISSWQPESFINDSIIKHNNIKSNWEYRRYLQANANTILKYNFEDVCNDTGYVVYKTHTLKHSGPVMYSSFYDKTKPPNDNDSDLKELYLSRERLESRKIAPEMTQSELTEKWGIHT